MLEKRKNKMYILENGEGADQEGSFLSYFYGIFCAFMISLCVYSTLWCLMDGLYTVSMFLDIFLYIFLMSVVLYWIQILRIKNHAWAKPAKIIVLLIFFVLTIIFLKDIIEGLAILCNQEITFINEYYSVEIPFLTLSRNPLHGTNNLYVIKISFLFLGLALSMLISHIFYGKRSTLLYLILTVPFAMLPVICGRLPNAIPYTLYGLCTLIYVGSKGTRVNYQDINMQKQVMLVLTGALLCITLCMMLVYSPSKYDKEKPFHENKVKIQAKMSEMLTKEYWQNNTTLNRILGYSSVQTSDGNLSNVKTVRFRGEKVLELSVPRDDTADLYLKGFVGEYYDGNKWSVFSDENTDGEFEAELAKLEDNILNVEQLYKFEMMLLSRVPDTKIMQVANLKNQKKYIPYGILGDYETDEHGLVRIEDTSGIYEYYSGYKNLMTGYVNIMQAIDSGSIDENYIEQNYINFNLNEATDTYQYIKIRKFIEKYYTTIENCPSMITDELVKDILDTYGDGEASDVTTKIVAVQKYLTDNFTYTLTIPKKRKGIDFVDNFLKTEKGYCVHYATTATLLLRKMGVPTRYVEGYFVDGETLKKENLKNYLPMSLKRRSIGGNELYPVYAKDSDGHAWVEVYIDCLGFVPVEMTYSNSASEIPFSENVTPTPEVTPTRKPEEQKETGDNKENPVIKKDSEKINKSGNVSTSFLFFGVFLVIVTSALYLQRYFRQQRFYQRLSVSDYNEQIDLYYDKLEKVFASLKLTYMGNRRLEYASAIYDLLEEKRHYRTLVHSMISRKDFIKSMDIMFKARYGKGISSKDELDIITDFYYRIRVSIFSVKSLLLRGYYYFILVL